MVSYQPSAWKLLTAFDSHDSTIFATTQTPEQLQKAYEITPKKDEWVFLGELGQSLRQIDPQFKSKTYGQKGLSQLISQYLDVFEMRTEKGQGKTPQMYIKL